MARQFISVCMFCFICATHSPCASHAEVRHVSAHRHDSYSNPDHPPLIPQKPATNPREKPKGLVEGRQIRNPSTLSAKNISHTVSKRNSDKIKSNSSDYNSGNNSFKNSTENSISNNDNNNSNKNNSSEQLEFDDVYLKRLFSMFGDGDTMSLNGFEKLMEHLELFKVKPEALSSDRGAHSDFLIKNELIKHSSNRTESDGGASSGNKPTCVLQSEILAALGQQRSPINNSSFQKACPALLYGVIVGGCSHKETHFFVENIIKENNNFFVWLYSIGAVFIISACGVLALVIIPVMQKRFYKPLLQFLVALAVGTLAGDALLHLLPHAMSGGGGEHAHAHLHEDGETNHNENMWKGFVAMLGLTFFFVMERFILLATKWRKGKQRKKAHSHVKVLSNGRDTNKSRDTQCMDKYNPSPLCYKDILDDPHTQFLGPNKTTSTMLEELGSNPDHMKKSLSEKLETNQNMTDCPNIDLNNTSCNKNNKMPDEFTVILREHETKHHGHSHTHGHVHAAPKNLSSVAWMVIMGDGLHNFTDGMAIGAAFSGSITGGFSTAVAVFCHELPHELGDFAMLLKAGMSIKQAMVYNLLSSILCIFGNIAGVWLGNTESASSWVFAAAAGMFVYIALVDMIPELSSAHEDESNLTQCLLHLSGLLAGFGIMTVIALYEHDLKTIFNETQ